MCVLDGMDCDTIKGAAAAASASGLLSDLLCGNWGYASDKRKLISQPSEGISVLLIIQTRHHGQTHRPEHIDTLPELLMSCGCVSTNTTDAAVMAPCLRTYVWGFSPASWVIRKELSKLSIQLSRPWRTLCLIHLPGSCLQTCKRELVAGMGN